MSMSPVGNANFNFDRTGALSGAPGAGHQSSAPAENNSTLDNLVRRISRTQSFSNGTPLRQSQSRAQDKETLANEKDLSPVDSDVDSEEKRDKAVTDLARQYTNASTYAGVNPFEPEKDSSFDPWGTNFKPRQWAKAMINLQLEQPGLYKPRTSGIAFRDLNAFGYGSSTDYQKTVSTVVLQVVGLVQKLFGYKGRRIDILSGLDGVVHAGEMLVVLGPPGSGCSTFLKTVSQDTHGFQIDKKSYLNYQGVSAKQMAKDFRGEVIYTAEVDVHFPQLSVGDTLDFAARARVPRHLPHGVNRDTYVTFQRDVMMAVFGIGHTIHTRVGNDFVRGVSGGERKRVTIAEAALSGAPLQCWDNSTRGLDSANAIEFCKTLRMQSDMLGTTSAVAIYQAPQSAYDIFDKVLLLYEGRQIFFGPAGAAKDYFVNMGFYKEDRATTPDFLTSMTAADERIAREGFEDRVPRTPDEFAARWKASPEYTALREEISQYEQQYTVGGEYLERFKESRRHQQSKVQRIGSPYTLSYAGQVALCLRRGFQRVKGDPFITLFQLFGNLAMAFIVGSVFYNLQSDTDSFFSRGALLFFAVLLNAFGSALEILTLYAQRPIVEKQSRYAFYHPSAEAFASMLTDMPYKIVNAIIFNITIYFITNLRREAGPFFFFLFVSFLLTLVMSMLFRFIGSVSRSLAQAMAPTAILILGIVMYTGFAIPVPYMLGWSRWINYLDPVAYGFESLIVNEFNNRLFTCSQLLPFGPTYLNSPQSSKVCSVKGSVPGSLTVQGTDYIIEQFDYNPGNKWRNVGILFVFMVGLCVLYLIAAELVTEKKSKGEVLVFRRGHVPLAAKKLANKDDPEAAAEGREVALTKTKSDAIIERQTAIFHWRNVCYDIKVKGGDRRLLDHIDGWVKPGTLTALMGVSGAGKTTLLDVLATRTTMGVISGDMLVDGRSRDDSFQRKTGYVQQQDLHLPTSTVREALNFSALLRQPAQVSRKEKLDYVNDVIKLLEMDEYADAVVGVPGEGLNVEQRKRLTIGVELAAKPELLLFLDEPTSGLDSQTSWAILDLMEKLTKNGQAVLCTIHQPSAVLFQRFDRLLFLQKGGQTVYFGEIGHNSEILTSYFEGNGAKPCPVDANPAEWMLEVIGAAPGSKSEIDWFKTWQSSTQYNEVHAELDRLERERPQETKVKNDKASYREFAATFWMQYSQVQNRVFQQYWRTPSYIYSKLSLCLFSSLFIGFSFFNAGTTQQALQNQMFSIFLLFTIFGQLVQQIQPNFVTQRALYEARERPSKTYSWKAFMLSMSLVEIPWAVLTSIIVFVCWYYPVGLYKNAEVTPFNPTSNVHIRGFLMFLLVFQFLLFASTFAIMLIAAIEHAEQAGNLANLLFSLTLIFCGVIAGPGTFPGFWIFMYRISPFTYLVEAMLGTGLANNVVTCSTAEYLRFPAPSGQTCAQYMEPFILATQGYLSNPNSSGTCEYCALSNTNQFLAAVNAKYDHRWRDFGILWVYIGFNVVFAVFLYWLGRVPKKSKKVKKE